MMEILLDIKLALQSLKDGNKFGIMVQIKTF